METIKSSPWKVFISPNCGFCDKAKPIIEELNKEGYNLQIQDIIEPAYDRSFIRLKQQYNIDCGTPLFINVETGTSVCGFNSKIVIEKWLKGEINMPTQNQMPTPIGDLPPLPLLNISAKELKEWKADYKRWYDKNDHLLPEQRLSVEDALALPRPITTPPPQPSKTFTDNEWDEWIIVYDKWAKENAHLDEPDGGKLLTGGALRERLLELKAERDPEITFSFKLQQLHERIEALEKKLGMEMPYEAQFSV
tara:strand:+ start:482 stop:1234 length:753 start_codon:yes stop_codon:yes gene_type:complete